MVVLGRILNEKVVGYSFLGFRLLGFLVFVNLASAIDSIQTDTMVRMGEIRLGQLPGSGEVHYYELHPPDRAPKMSVGLFGHIYRPSDLSERYLTSPVLWLERRKEEDANGSWTRLAAAESPGKQIEVARIQNYPVENGYVYRLGVGTQSPVGGRYALVVDPAMEGYEFEVEDLDLGEEPGGQKHTLATGYAVADPNTSTGVRVYAGTDNGYILTSGDDAKTWRQLYPPPGEPPLLGTIFGLFVDSQGIIYASPWTSADQVAKLNLHGFVLESRDGGDHWSKVVTLQWPTGVAWRIAEDWEGNVFLGEYSGLIVDPNAPLYPGNVWRRKNHGNGGESFEVVFANPRENPDTLLNHTHFVGIDPYTDVVYAAIGDGGVGRFVRSRQHGDPGTWETLERGVDAQYTSMAFTPQFLFMGMDSNKQFKKIVRWDKTKNGVDAGEPFWTTAGMDFYLKPPIPWVDKGNWFWGHYFVNKQVLAFQYMPYGDVLMSNGQMQPPRLYAGIRDGDFWWRAITFPPNPIREVPRWGENGPKFSSNIALDGWVYAMRGTLTGEIHRGFRFRLKSEIPTAVESWKFMR